MIRKGKNGKRQAVVAYDKRGVVVHRYRSIVEASEILHYEPQAISTQCRGISKYPLKGLSFAYADSEESRQNAIKRATKWLSNEQFKTIPGYEEYEVSSNGVVRRKSDGRVMKPYKNEKYSDYSLVNVKKPHWKEVRNTKVIKLMAITYLGMTDEYIAFNKDGNKPEFDLDNIGFDFPENIEKHTGRKCFKRARAVLKIYVDGTTKRYSSITQCAKEEYLYIGSIERQCKGNAIKPMNGFTFAFVDDEESIAKAKERLKWKRKKRNPKTNRVIKAVVVIDRNRNMKRFRTTGECEKWSGANVVSIRDHCRGFAKSPYKGKFTFAYADDEAGIARAKELFNASNNK